MPRAIPIAAPGIGRMRRSHQTRMSLSSSSCRLTELELVAGSLLELRFFSALLS